MNSSMDKPELESLGYELEAGFKGLRTIDKPVGCPDLDAMHLGIPNKPEQLTSVSSEVKQTSNSIFEPETGDEKSKGADQPLEQPNKNIMLLEQAEGAINEAKKLLGQLEAKTMHLTTQKESYLWILEGWQKHNFKHLRKAFK